MAAFRDAGAAVASPAAALAAAAVPAAAAADKTSFAAAVPKAASTAVIAEAPTTAAVAVGPATAAASAAAAAASPFPSPSEFPLLVEPLNSGPSNGEGPVRIRCAEDMTRLKEIVQKIHKERYQQIEKEWGDKEGLLLPNNTEGGVDYTSRARSQHIPLGASRWAVLLLFLSVVFCKGCTYGGWNGLQNMLYKSGAFSWKCNSEVSPSLRVGSGVYIDCPARKGSINNLYTIAFSSNLIFSAFGGVILDSIGPKLTLLITVFLDCIGWGLLATASERVPSYPAALMFIGMAAGSGYLSLLCVANLFPGKESTVMGLMGSLRSLSFCVPVSMAAVYNKDRYKEGDLWKVLVFYIAVLLGFCLSVCLLFVPWKKFKCAEDFKREDREKQLQLMREATLKQLPASFFLQQEQQQQQQQGQHQQHDYKLLLTKKQHDEMLKAMKKVEKEVGRKGQKEPSLRDVLKDPRFLLMLPVLIINLLRVQFYTKSNKEQLALPDGSNVYTFFSTMNIFSFVPGPFLGYLADKLGTICVLHILNGSGIAMYALLFPSNIASRYASVCCFWINTSFILSSMYCYIKKHFPNRLFGSLSGISCLIGGCFALTSLGWYRLSTQTLFFLKTKNFWPVDGGIIVASILDACILGVLATIDKKSQTKMKREEKEGGEEKAKCKGMENETQGFTKEENETGMAGTVEMRTAGEV